MKHPLTALEGQAGYFAPRHARGLQTTQQLLEAGRRLLRDRSLEQLTIQDLCAHAQVTSGAFYSRFDGKENYFRALQRLLLLRLQALIETNSRRLDKRAWELRPAVELMARTARRWTFCNEGVLRASLVERVTAEADPIRQLNRQYVDAMIPRLARLHPGGASAVVQQRLGFAFQAMSGALMFALVNRGGSYALADRRLEEEMARAFYLYIAHELDAPGRK